MTAMTTVTKETMKGHGGAMKAVVQEGYGAPLHVLRLETVDRPSFGDDDVLIRVRATSVNTPDWVTVTGVPYVMRLRFGLRKPRTPVPVDVPPTVRFNRHAVICRTGSLKLEPDQSERRHQTHREPNQTHPSRHGTPPFCGRHRPIVSVRQKKTERPADPDIAGATSRAFPWPLES
jgi:hypothetical protein